MATLSLPRFTDSDFKLYDSFHLFYFSRKDDQTFFLHTSHKSEPFSHITGSLQELDAGILFSAGRKVIEMSYGLLTKQNLEMFKEGSMYQNVSRDMLQLCKPNLQVPALMNSKVFQQFIEDTFDAMISYQNETNSNYYFVEIPYVDTNKFNQFCLENSINLQIKYDTMIDFCSCENLGDVNYETKSLYMDESLNGFIQTYIEKAEPIPIKSRYAVICIYTTPTNYRTMGILGSCFKKHGEQWRFYRFPVEEPTDEELSALDGIFIPGASVCAADKSLPWRERLLDLIRKAYNQNDKCKILGTCFGIQILAEAFDGKSARMDQCVLGSCKLAISGDFWELPYVKGLDLVPRNDLLLPKSHFDCVVEPPLNAKVYASSKCANVEIMTMGDRCLAFQGHPEMNEAWTACLIYQTTKEKMNFKVYYEEAKKKYFKEKLEHEMWLNIIYNFFKNQKGSGATRI